MRKGVLFHNGREVDAAAVKWNYERIQDPKKSHAFTRSALKNLKEVIVDDKYTVVCKLHSPSAVFPSNVVTKAPATCSCKLSQKCSWPINGG